MALEPRGPSNKKKSLFSLVYFSFSLCWMDLNTCLMYVYVYSRGGRGEENNYSSHSMLTPKTAPRPSLISSLLFKSSLTRALCLQNRQTYFYSMVVVVWCRFMYVWICGCWPTFWGAFVPDRGVTQSTALMVVLVVLVEVMVVAIVA